jgi:transcriptional regulator with XRE-family HTH domain
VARSTIQRLERGQLRPRVTTLRWIANAIDPDRREATVARLIAAARDLDELAPPDEGWDRYQLRRMNERLRSGRLPLPLAWERKIRLTAAADAMHQTAMTLDDRAAAALGRPGTDSMVDELMDLSEELREESGRLAADVGIRVVGVPPRRWRGDPPDVSPFAPPAADLAAVRRWVREWQVREGAYPAAVRP